MAETERMLVGGSAAMRDVRAQVARAADASSPVLIRGERGTGKAAVAHAIHAAGHRGGGPLVVVDCGALPDDDLAAELGGRLGRAAGGTLLLREVGAIGPAVADELLGAFQAPTGDVRVLATTAHDLNRLAADGAFPGALLDRLATETIIVPPLRNRPEDVPDLCRHFLLIAGRRERRLPRNPDPAVLDLFRQYAWRRNVRELRNFVERACTVDGTDNPLRAEVVEPWLRAAAIDPVAATVEALAGQPLAHIEKQVILSTLQQFRGHRIKTAEALGIGVRTLGIKLKRWRDEGDLLDAHSRAAG